MNTDVFNQLSSCQFEIKQILNEYVDNDNCCVEECGKNIKTFLPNVDSSQLVYVGCVSVLKTSKLLRLRMGFLFNYLITSETISLKSYCAGLQNVLQEADSICTDIRNVWDYMAELIVPIMYNDTVTSASTIYKLIKFLARKDIGPELLACMFKLVIQEKGMPKAIFSDCIVKSEISDSGKPLFSVEPRIQQNLIEKTSKNKGESFKTFKHVKLHEAETPWRPFRFWVYTHMTVEERKTEQLYRKIRGILNKLTPQKFDTLLDQIRSLTIDTTERLQGIIDLVFEKAVDEPNFSVAYALLCRELALMQVPATDVKKKDGQEFVNFRKLLVTKCQLKFEKYSLDEIERNQKVKDIEECTDPEKKKDMQLNLEEYDRRLRMKSVGNIRFIGELFKQQMLTVNIMIRCLNNLLETKDEESLECLCKLLTTVGKELEINKKVDLTIIFATIKEIADKKNGNICNKVRFMIQDVIDLRGLKWVPHRPDQNPKTIDQIQKKAENEHLTQQAFNSVPMTPRRDERGTGGGGGGGGDGGGGNMNANTDKKRRNVSNDEGWSTATSRGSRTPFTVQSDKLKNKLPMMDKPLGSSHMFGNWRRCSNIKTPSQPPLTNSANMRAALETINTDGEKRSSLGLRPIDTDLYNSKERNYRQPCEGGQGSCSDSQHRSRDSSTAAQRKAAPAPVPSIPKAQPLTPNVIPVAAPVELSPEYLERRIKNILEEYLNDCCSVQECEQDIKSSISPSALPQLVSYGYISVLERSKTARLRAGYLFAQLIKLGTLSLQDYCIGLEAVLEEADEWVIDIPRVWDYVAELISPILCQEAATLKDLHKSFGLLIRKNHASKLLILLFKLIIQEKGPNFLQNSWNNSGFTFANYMPESEVDNFVKENNFGFLLEAGNSCPISKSHSSSYGQSQLSYEEIYDKLLAFFKSGTSFDDIINWITANVGDCVKENQFIRTLATACFTDSIVNLKLKTDILQGKYNLLHRFVDNKQPYELQCLYALQALINKLKHPQGLLLAICDKLYEENVFAHESFVAWEASKDPAEQEGKGVALKQLNSFFTQLKEADEDSSSSEDA
ncbi:hypothetical protein ILUMI_25980 [Ignelater luminosus]|uniref:Eukaryotic translation initiation factor 4 gamma 3 n=1 Tax=Ignelater luminosus TaxID=2038154 RepID=A0A8K0C4T0_IGNLU|nr:hypothetical protein ILUMI_25980 [Ignelater luminosus]